MEFLTRPFTIPLRWRFRGVRERSGVLIRGAAGWGEFSPFPGYGPTIAARWLAAAVEAARDGWPRPLRTRIPVNVTVPALSPLDAHELVKASGCTTAKVKVGDAGDVERVEAVRDALGPRGKVRIDVNGMWDVDSAAKKIRTLNVYDLEYVEQPVSRLADMARLRKMVDVPLAVDESLRTAPDPRRVRGLRDAADILVLKVQPLGGVRRALEVAEAYGLPCVVSSAVETSVGIAAGLALAGALPVLPYACGLGTVLLLSADVTDDPLVPVNGVIPARRPEVDEKSLEALAPSGADASGIMARFDQAVAALGDTP